MNTTRTQALPHNIQLKDNTTLHICMYIGTVVPLKKHKNSTHKVSLEKRFFLQSTDLDNTTIIKE